MKKILICLMLVTMLFTFNFNVDAARHDSGNVKNPNQTTNKNDKNESMDDSENKKENSYNNYDSASVTCGDGIEFSNTLVNVGYYSILIFQVATPIAIIIFGMIDLAKGVISQKDDERKKGQSVFIKRLIIGILVFLVIMIAKMIIGFFGNDGVMECVNCFFNGAKNCR